MSTANIDHHARAQRLEAIIDNARHINEWWHDYERVSLDGEIPCVPYRYAMVAYQDDSTILYLFETLEEARASCEGCATGDESAGHVMDLDTNEEWEPHVAVTLKHLDTRVEWEVTYEGEDEGESAHKHTGHVMVAAADAAKWAADYSANGEGYRAWIAQPECICTEADDPNDHRKDCPMWGYQPPE